MIESAIVFLTLMGTISAIVTWLIITGGDRKFLPVVMLVGTTTGIFSAVIWAYLTGGLEITINAVAITSILSLTITSIVLYYAPTPKSSYSYNKGATLSLIVLIILTFLVAYSSMPQSYPASLSEATHFTAVNLNSIEPTADYTNPQIPVDITGAVSSVKLFSTSETPSEGDYLQFRVEFTVSTADWEQPYITLAIYHDTNNDSTHDSGDILVNDLSYKVVTGNSKWRANVIYDDNPHEIFTNSEGNPLPIFHANAISIWKDDTQFELANTPEKFTPAHDMLSWDADGNLKEAVTSYATIPRGSTAAIEGKFYCQNAGTYYILVKAFDARFTEPYQSGQPLAEKLIPFVVIPAGGDGGGGGTPSFTFDWILAIALTAISIPAVAITITRRW